MRARKRFGQNFLHDQNVISRIISSVNPGPGQHIVEIGPGHGALTKHLVESDADLQLIEIDRDLIVKLESEYNVPITSADVLEFDFNSIDRPFRVVGNLPYNISTPLLLKLLGYADNIIDMTFMLQLEVANRLAASNGTKAFGRLTVMCQYYCQVEKLFQVSKGAFTPAPKVESAIVRLTPIKPAVTTNPDLMEKILQDVFSQRRKTLRNAFSKHLSADELVSINIDPTLRPEQLSVADFVNCTNLVLNKIEQKKMAPQK